MCFDKSWGDLGSLQWGPKIRSYPVYGGGLWPRQQPCPAGPSETRRYLAPQGVPEGGLGTSMSLATRSMFKSSCFLFF